MNKVNRFLKGILIPISLLYCQSILAQTLYVDVAATGSNNGSSWSNAFADLQDALDSNMSGNVDSILIAEGTYYPTESPDDTSTDARNKAFHLADSNVIIIGGYDASAGTKTGDTTFLSADLVSPGIASDSAYHVFISSGLDTSSLFDNLVFTSGKAVSYGTLQFDGTTFLQYWSGGLLNIYSSQNITNCTFSNNQAGLGCGVYNLGGSSQFTSCSFTNNKTISNGSGGAVFNSYNSSSFTNCSFTENYAKGVGGAIVNSDANTSMANCLFNLNTASSDGGVVFNRESTPRFTQCIFTNNSSGGEGGGIYSYDSELTIHRSIFYSNSADEIGGGIYNYISTINDSNCVFIGNSAENGGAIWHFINGTDTSSIVNNSFINNDATYVCGGLGIQAGDPLLTNNLFFRNTSSNYPSLYLAPSESFNTLNKKNASDEQTSVFQVDLSQYFYKDLFLDSSDFDGSDNIWMTEDDGLWLVGHTDLVRNGSSTNAPTHDITGNERSSPPSIGAYSGDCRVVTKTMYVDHAASGDNTGLDWQNAFTSLQTALDIRMSSYCIEKVLVAQGIHYPTSSPNESESIARDRAFHLADSNITVIGGYDASTGNWTGASTTLSGDLLTAGTAADSAFHVLVTQDLDSTSMFKYLTISSGNADSAGSIQFGGFSFARNMGGGILNVASSPSFINCIFRNNSAENGGAMYNRNSAAPTLTNSILFDNIAFDYGGGIFNSSSSPCILHCNIVNNYATKGGGIYNDSVTCQPLVTNSLFYKNSASNSGQSISNSNSANLDSLSSHNASNSDVSKFPNTIFDLSSYSFADLFLDSTNFIGPDAKFGTSDDGLSLNVSPLLYSPLKGNGKNVNTITHDILESLRPNPPSIGAYDRGCSYTLYVDSAASGNNNGNDWPNAYTDLQSALDYRMSSSCVGSIHIAQGTYYPTESPDGSSTNDRNKAFHLDNSNVTITGGYDASLGTKTGDATILSGDLVTAGTGSDSVYHVFISTGLNSNSIFNNLTFSSGNADTNGSLTFNSVSYDNNNGGGLYLVSSSPTIKNCTFNYNSATNGGGIYMNLSNPKITDCVFNNDSAINKGGAIYALPGGDLNNRPTMERCVFSKNHADYGGAICSRDGFILLQNCLLSNNTARYGGAVYNSDSSSSDYYNCSFISNTASAFQGGGGMRNSNSRPAVTNCLFFNNNTALTDGGTLSGITGSHNASDKNLGNFIYQLTDLSTYHFKDLFVDSLSFIGADNVWMTGDDGLRLQSNSILAGVGTTISGLTKDILKNTRPNPRSLGAYEGECNGVSQTIFVDHLAQGSNSGQNWTDAFQNLQQALNITMSCPNSIDTILIAEGTYYPTESPNGSSTDRDRAFYLADSNVYIIGGYDASEGTKTGGKTILSGDLVTAGNASDSAYHVFISTGLDSTSIFDNLVFSHGTADANGSLTYKSTRFDKDVGGGLYLVSSSPTITNCTFSNNNAKENGGGIHLDNSSPNITNTIISDNTSDDEGAGMYIKSSAPSIANSVITNNNAVNYGAGIYHNNATTTLTNCIFASNSADDGGGMYNKFSATPTLINCTFVSNASSDDGAAMFNSGNGTDPTVTNSLFFKNTATGSGNSIYNQNGSLTSSSNNNASDADLSSFPNTKIDLSSSFYKDLVADSTDFKGADNEWMTADDGLMLLATSPIRNEGLNSVVSGVSFDITGQNRIISSSVDIGAYESTILGLRLPTSPGTHTSDEAFEVDDWTYYINSSTMDLLLALKLGNSGAVVNSTAVRLKIGTSKTISWLDSGGLIANLKGGAMIDRYWDVTPTTQPSGLVGVKYYFTEDEFTALKDTMANHNGGTSGYPSTINSITELGMFKLRNAAAFTDPHTSGVDGIVLANHATTPDTTFWVYASYQDDHSAEFEVSSFSGGGGGGGGGGGAGSAALPVELIVFTARKANQTEAQINWATASEIDNSHFIIQKSYDGISFMDAQRIVGNGNSQVINHYSFLDKKIQTSATRVYYRLKQVDYNGVYSYSQTRVVQFDIKKAYNPIHVSPNPFNETLNVVFTSDTEQEVDLSIHDLSGKLVYHSKLNVQTGYKVEPLDLHHLRSGLYILEVSLHGRVDYIRIVKN